MFSSLWRRFSAWRSQRPITRRPARRTRLEIDVLEDRLTPSNYSATIFTNTTTGVNTLVLTKTSGNESLTLTNDLLVYQEFDVNTTGTINGVAGPYVTPKPVTAITINMGSGTDSITIDGVTNGVINLTAGMTITGSGGDKTINAQGLNVLHNSNLTMTLNNNGNETTTFTDCNITGKATISHGGSGTTNFNIGTSGANTYAINTWGSLTITNGTGTDTNTITDTNFTGNISISNGAGAPGNTSQFGGSHNLFADGNNFNVLSVSGNLSISTSSGHSDTEINDYNVHGTLTINAGNGISGQSFANLVGVENNQSVLGSAIPVMGNIVITGSAVPNLPPGLNVLLGTDSSVIGNDYPLNIAGNLSITASGSGAATFTLNDLHVGGTATLTTNSTTRGNLIQVLGDQTTSVYSNLTINSSAASNTSNNVNLQTKQGNLIITNTLTVGMNIGGNTLTLGTGGNPVNAGIIYAGTFKVTSSSGNQTINVQGDTFNSLNFAQSGTGSRSTTFTDTNVVGSAILNHTGTGDTTLLINTTLNNINLLNTWGSLSITNGTGSDLNTIKDTDFKGSVTINNGNGGSGNTGLYGGSHTVFSDGLNQNPLTIHGNLTITTATGQSDSEVYDYYVSGNVVMSTGNGITNQSSPSLIGIENNQTVLGSGVPVIGGSVTVTGTAKSNTIPGVIINMGTNGAAKNYPLVIGVNLTVNVNGTGSANVKLNDLSVATGKTSITFGSLTKNVLLQIQGSTVTSVYDTFTLLSYATGNNTYSLQDKAGTLQITGVVSVTLGAGTDTLNLAADSANSSGVAGSVLELFQKSTFNGGSGIDSLWEGTVGTNVFFITLPVFISFP